MDLPGSVNRENRKGATCLFVSDGQAKLAWNWSSVAYPRYGSASCRKAA
jgi:hypothetical protein